MQLSINGTILVFIAWLIRSSFQLDCLQCTSPIRRVSDNWDHSCLDGTLLPSPCQHGNDSTETFNSCMSNLYRLALRSSGGKKIIIQIYK